MELPNETQSKLLWFFYMLPLLGSYFSLLVEGIDVLLNKLKRRKEDGINDTRSAHGDTQSAVHVAFKELDLRRRFDGLPLGV